MGKVTRQTDSDALRDAVATLQELSDKIQHRLLELESFAHYHIEAHGAEEALSPWQKIKKLFK